MSIVSLVIAPTLASLFHTRDTGMAQQHRIEKKATTFAARTPGTVTLR